MFADAWSSGFVFTSAVLVAVAVELVARARRRAELRRRCPDVEPVPWRDLERLTTSDDRPDW
jgi:hypothetical protein